MNGKLVATAIVLPAILFGALVYYTQVYAYYTRLDPQPMALVRADGGTFPLRVADWQGIDAASSPLRFRACFRTALPQDTGFQPYPGAEPLVAPGWFSCFDAGAIEAGLAAGQARAYLGQRDIHPDVDRVIVVFDDGRAFAWQQLNPSAKD